MAFMRNETQAMNQHDELRISSRRGDGSFSKPVIVWFVEVDGEMYLRSVRGDEAAWYRAAVNRGVGRVEIGGEDYDVSFEAVGALKETEITNAFRAKYEERYPEYTPPTYTPEAVAATIHFDALGTVR